MYNGLIDLSGAPIDDFTEDNMSELLALRKEKELHLSSVHSVKTPLEGSSDDGISNILHSPLSIHLIPAGTALVDSPLGIGIRSPPHNDSVAYVRTGHYLINLLLLLI